MLERRVHWLLIVLLVGQLILITLQTSGSRVQPPLLARGVLWLVGPVARTVTAVVEVPGHLRHQLKAQRRLVAENEALHDQVRELRLELLRLQGLESDLERLAQALDYARAFPGRLQVADVVYADVGSRLRSLMIYTGGRPVEHNQPVVAPEGLVGRVVSVAGDYAQVQLIIDGAAAVGAMVERSRRQGVVHGRPLAEQQLEMRRVPSQADVRAGDRILTSGIDNIFPRGIPVGSVEAVEPTQELFARIQIRPAVDFHRLDQVYLLPRRSLPDEIQLEMPLAPP